MSCCCSVAPWQVTEKAIILIAAAHGGLLHAQGSLLRVARLGRAGRVLRTLRLGKSSRSVQSLLMTLLYSIPPLLNILGIFCILMFTYAVLGMELFSAVLWQQHLNAEVCARIRRARRALLDTVFSHCRRLQ